MFQRDIGAGNLRGECGYRRLTNDEGKSIFLRGCLRDFYLFLRLWSAKQTTLWGRLKQPVHD